MATLETTVPTENEQLAGINADYEERYGFHDAENYLYKAPKGLNREIVEKISEFKSEPEWMRDFRLKALDHFLARNQPTCGSPMLPSSATTTFATSCAPRRRPAGRGTTCPRTSSGLLTARGRTWRCAAPNAAALLPGARWLPDGDAVVSDEDSECVSRCLVGE